MPNNSSDKCRSIEYFWEHVLFRVSFAFCQHCGFFIQFDFALCVNIEKYIYFVGNGTWYISHVISSYGTSLVTNWN